MKKAYLLLLLAPSALVYACGGDDSTDGGTDSGNKDSTTGTDAAADTSTTDVAADSAKDSGTTDAPADVTISITCLEPANCIDGGALDAAYPPADSGIVCCGTVVTTGAFPNCALSGASTACMAPSACASNVNTSSCGNDTFRLCEGNSECTETNFNKCCSAKVGDAATVKLCASTTIAALSGGQITCN